MKQAFTTFLLLLCASIISAQNDDQYIVVSKTLNMRSGSGKQYEIVEKLSQDDVVTLIEKLDNGWWQVDFNGTEGYVLSNFLKHDPYTDWERKNYESGVTPECENVTPQYDFQLDNYLRIKVGSGTDVVVKLMRIGDYEDNCIRIVYVRSGDTYEIKNIPESQYYLKIAYGKDYRQKIVSNQCVVKFIKNAIYEKGTDILNFTKIKKPNQTIGDSVYESWDIPSFELSLDVIKLSNHDENSFNSNSISEEEFNK